MAYVQLNYNFVHVGLKKYQGLRAPKDLRGSEQREEKKKRGQNRRRKDGQRKCWNTKDDVILRGEG